MPHHPRTRHLHHQPHLTHHACEQIDVQTVYQEEMVDFRYNCSVCGQERCVKVDKHGLDFYRDSGIMLRIVCPKCDGQLGPSTVEYFRHKAEQTRGRPETQFDKRLKTWVPPIYQDSEEERFPQNIWKTHGDWVKGQRGVIFYGPPQCCKSRMAYQMAINQLKLGNEVRCYDPRSFRAMIERNIANKTLWDWYENDAMVPFFLLDDLGKFRGEGRRIEEEVFNFIKLRHEQKLGLVVTSNCDGNELAAMFTPSIGIPIVERLNLICKPVLVDRQLTQETELPHVVPHNADL